jgi:hypothetical protein
MSIPGACRARFSQKALRFLENDHWRKPVTDPREETLAVQCDFCTAGISPVEFEKGRAVRLLGKSYCSQCLDRAIEKGRNPEAHPGLLTPFPWNRSSDRRPDTTL